MSPKETQTTMNNRHNQPNTDELKALQPLQKFVLEIITVLVLFQNYSRTVVPDMSHLILQNCS